MHRRHFRHAAPSFPIHYEKLFVAGKGYRYSTMYTSPLGNVHLIEASNEWFDYLGDIIMDISRDIEQIEKRTVKEARCEHRGKGREAIANRGKVSKVQKRLNLV